MIIVITMSAIVTHGHSDHLHYGAAVELIFVETTNNLSFRHKDNHSLQQHLLHLCDKNDDFLPNTPVAVRQGGEELRHNETRRHKLCGGVEFT